MAGGEDDLCAACRRAKRAEASQARSEIEKARKTHLNRDAKSWNWIVKKRRIKGRRKGRGNTGIPNGTYDRQPNVACIVQN